MTFHSSVAIVTTQAFSMVNFRGDLIRALVQTGVKVWALAPDYTAEQKQTLIQLGAHPVDIPISRSGLNPVADLLGLLFLYRWFLRERPQVVLNYFMKPVIYGTLAAWAAGVRHRVCMIEGLGFAFTQGQESPTFKRRILRRIATALYGLSLRRAHKIIFLNPDDAAEFQALGLAQTSQSNVLGGIGVDLTQWAPTPLTLKPITFIMVARLLKDKGVVEYVQAARRIKRLYPQVRFLLLGDVDTNPDSLSAATVSQWVQEQLLEWPGHVPVQPWLGQSDVFVLPSYREGVPRSTQEAMAMGRPVITTNVPGCRETVVDGDNGYLIPAQSADALFEAMQQCVLHPEVLHLMGRRSRQMAEDKFDIQVINQKLMSLLEVAPSAAH